jgi:hypothetical protein
MKSFLAEIVAPLPLVVQKLAILLRFDLGDDRELRRDDSRKLRIFNWFEFLPPPFF